MAFREVRVFEIREVLRVWLAGEGFRSPIERLVGVDRKTVRRYVGAAESLGLIRDGGEEQLTDVFVGMVVEAVRPHRTDGRGESWRLLAANHDQIAEWVKADLTAVKIHDLLGRRDVCVPCRTVQRYVLEVCGRCRGRGSTVRVADGEPGDELQVDFGRMGLLFDPAVGRRRVVWALIFTACYSRHCFVWLTHRPGPSRRSRRRRRVQSAPPGRVHGEGARRAARPQAPGVGHPGVRRPHRHG